MQLYHVLTAIKPRLVLLSPSDKKKFFYHSLLPSYYFPFFGVVKIAKWFGLWMMWSQLSIVINEICVILSKHYISTTYISWQSTIAQLIDSWMEKKCGVQSITCFDSFTPYTWLENSRVWEQKGEKQKYIDKHQITIKNHKALERLAIKYVDLDVLLIIPLELIAAQNMYLVISKCQVMHSSICPKLPIPHPNQPRPQAPTT